MKNLYILDLIVVLTGIVGYGGLWYFYGWELPLFLFIVLFGDNLNKNISKIRKKMEK